jgi:AraC-like DNA-binding protein
MKRNDIPLIEIMPKLYIWKSCRLFLGAKSIFFRNHTLAWDQFLVCMHGSIKIRGDNGEYQASQTCLIRAGTVVDSCYVDTTEAIVAIYYLNPISQDYFVLESTMRKATKGVCFFYPKQDQVVRVMHEIAGSNATPELAYLMLKGLFENSMCPPVKNKRYDPRIIKLVRIIRETVGENFQIHEYAKEVHLSGSHLAKLFKRQMGIPITKYRLQIRVSYGVIHLAAGRSSTEAAYLAGFSSSGHFSKCFSDMIGLQPSTTFLKPPYVKAYISDDVLDTLPVIF